MNKKQKKTMAMLVGLLSVALILFGYQNFFVPNQAKVNTQTIYVASKDIPADSMLTEDMLKAQAIGGGSVIDGAISNPSEVIGKRVRGGLLSGEVISRQRLADDRQEEGVIYVKVEPDYPVDLSDGEFVQVSHQSNDEKNPSITTLFSKKTVYSTSRVVSLVEAEANSGYYLMLTNDEMKQYYKAKSSGLVILNKITGVSSPNEVMGEAIQPSSTNNDNVNENETSGQSNLKYSVKSGDTYSTVSEDLDIEEDELRDLNPGVKELESGTMINLPE